MLSQANHQTYIPQYRNRSFSTCQYQTTSSPQKIYYNYPSKKYHYDEYHSNKDAAYRNIPSFGDGPNCRGFTKDTHFEEKSYIESTRKRSLFSLDHNQKAKFYTSIENYGSNKYDYDCKNEYRSLGRGSKVGLEKVTEEREQNIDRINQKIKRILDTLNEEEKKMSHNIHLKSHKNYRAYPQNNHRIKTEGNENYVRYEIERKHSQNKPNFKPNKEVNMVRNKNFGANTENVENVYGKLIGIREKYQTNFRAEERELLRDLTNQNIERKLKTEMDYERNTYSPTIAIQSPPKIKESSQTPFKLLKGANIKSTDSLSMISSVYLNHETFPEDRKPKIEVRRYDWEKNIEENRKNNVEFEGEKRTKIIEREQAEKCLNYFSKKETDSFKIQDFQYAKYETQEDEDQAFSSFGQSRNRAIEVTPQKTIERSISRYEKSEKSCKLSNGKDLDVEIEKIQKKIENFEQMKKELKIEESKNGLKSKERLNTSLRKYQEAKNSKEKGESTPKRSFILNSPYEQINKEFSQKFTQKQSNEPLKTLNPADQYEDFPISLPKPFSMSSNKNTKRAINNSNIKEIESAFISEDRFSKNNQAFELLILNLCTQIELDQNFRNSKKWFSRKASSSKWNELNQELRKINIHLNQNQLYEIFTMTEEEDNPFHTTREEDGTYKSLVENYVKACQFWEQNIHRKFIRREIENSISDMDIEKRNIVELYDIVRYINLESDKYFRNRDLYLIFKRLSSGRKEIGLEDVIGQFCQF